MSPVGRTICSTTWLEISISYGLGVADRNTTWLTFSMNSSKRNGRLSSAEGRRNPCSTSVSLRERSPSYCPWSCGTGDVRLVDHHEVVVGEVVEERVGHLARAAAVEAARVVLDPRAHPDLAHHLEVVGGAHPQALRLEQLAVLLEPRQPLGELDLDPLDRGAHVVVVGDVVRRGEQHEPVELLDDLAGERVDRRDALDLVAEELDADGPLLVGGEHLDGVAPHAELVAGERVVVALVLEVDEPGEDRALVALLPLVEDQGVRFVRARRAEPVDRRHRRDDDDVAARHQRAGGRVPEPVDLVVDRRVLLDVGVGGREVRLGLVVVVVRDEVLDPVLREQLPELARELRRQALVGREHDRGPVDLRDHRRGGEGLPGTRDAEQGLEPVAPLDSPRQCLDGCRLVAGGRQVGDELERGHVPMLTARYDKSSGSLKAR